MNNQLQNINNDINNKLNTNINNTINDTEDYTIVKMIEKVNYPVDIDSNVPFHLRTSSPNHTLPTPVPNGGLFGGPQAQGEYASIYVAPTATNLIHNNLLSANPPPGATEQYIGTNRLGNNYIAMPGVYWYNNTHPINSGPFEIKVTDNTIDLLNNSNFNN